MNSDETIALAALEQFLDLTDQCDWRLLHATVRHDVAARKYGRDFEKAYSALVDKKLGERKPPNLLSGDSLCCVSRSLAP